MKNSQKDNSYLTRKRYQRISRLYDFLEILPERMYRDWRKKLWAQVKGSKILEVGVGTGKNIKYYPPNKDITAIDLTPGMMEFAKRRAAEFGKTVEFRLDDAENLDFEDNTFDSVIATFVFCSVPNPVKGLKEIKRVLKPDGKMYLIEHVRSEKPVMGKFMDLINPVIVRLMGPNINRRTVDNVKLAGFPRIDVTNLKNNNIFKLIIAEK
jgi:ubiquinone/menaquinone biosynthesis C-methylase UbiE